MGRSSRRRCVHRRRTGRALILETTFLVDLERESAQGSPGPAHAFLADHGEERLCMTATTAGELAAGIPANGRPDWEELIRRLDVLQVDLEVCWHYGQLFQFLKKNGLLIGTNDLWIAAAAVAHEMPLVTRNVRHFRRVPSLEVRDYTAD